MRKETHGNHDTYYDDLSDEQKVAISAKNRSMHDSVVGGIYKSHIEKCHVEIVGPSQHGKTTVAEWIHLKLQDLGGHFKTGHTWTAQNRP